MSAQLSSASSRSERSAAANSWWPPQALLSVGVTMEMVNRSAVIVKPRQPYLEWAKQDDAEELAESVFETLHTEPTVYLLPEYEDPSSQHEVLAEFWPDLFEAMLEGWVTDEACWPKNRTLGMFREWFEVQMSSIVHDLYLDESLEYLE